MPNENYVIFTTGDKIGDEAEYKIQCSTCNTEHAVIGIQGVAKFVTGHNSQHTEEPVAKKETGMTYVPCNVDVTKAYKKEVKDGVYHDGSPLFLIVCSTCGFRQEVPVPPGTKAEYNAYNCAKFIAKQHEERRAELIDLDPPEDDYNEDRQI